jgi:uncharacterized protein (DUF58 family)
MTSRPSFGSFFLRRLPAWLDRRSGRPRVYILPTRPGWLFMLSLAGLLVGAVNYNNNLAFMLTFLLGSVLFVALHQTHGQLAGLSAGPVRAEPVFAGETAWFELALDLGGKERPVVTFRIEGGGETIVNLAPDDRNPVRLPLPATRRGVLRPSAVEFSSTFPLGLFRAWTRIPLAAEGLVYPHPVPGPGLPSAAFSGQGQGASGGRGVDDFKGIRGYIPGDSPKRIAWKASSRGGRMFTKEFEGQAGISPELDFHQVEGTDAEYKLSRLTYLLLQAWASGGSFGLKLPGRVIEPGQGRAHRDRCLEALARFGE